MCGRDDVRKREERVACGDCIGNRFRGCMCTQGFGMCGFRSFCRVVAKGEGSRANYRPSWIESK
jgi:hypothetical protein